MSTRKPAKAKTAPPPPSPPPARLAPARPSAPPAPAATTEIPRPAATPSTCASRPPSRAPRCRCRRSRCCSPRWTGPAISPARRASARARQASPRIRRRIAEYAGSSPSSRPGCPAHAVHRAARPGQTLQAARVEALALQPDAPVLPARRGMVAGRHHRHLRRLAHHEQVVSFAARQLLDVLSPGNYLPTNPVVLQRTLAAGGLNLLRGHEQRGPRHRRPRQRQPAGRRRRIRGRPRRGDHAGQGGAENPPDGTDPVRADHRKSAPRAGPDRAGVDHEVLHPRSVAPQLADQSTWSARATRCSASRGRTPAATKPTSAWTTTSSSASSPRSTRSTPSCPAARCTPPATASAAPCSRSPMPPWPATATRAWPP
jgi:hypothetical protein